MGLCPFAAFLISSISILPSGIRWLANFLKNKSPVLTGVLSDPGGLGGLTRFWGGIGLGGSGRASRDAQKTR
jgi:hypothetical protein